MHGQSHRKEATNSYHVFSSGADGYDNADVIMAMSIEEILDLIMDLGGSYRITYMRDYFVDFEEYDGGKILLGDGKECRIRGTGKVQVQMRDGSSFVLDNIMYVLELRRNLIPLVVLSRTRRANCAYTLDGHAVTRKTLKGRKQLGEYLSGWKRVMFLILFNQRYTQHCTKTLVPKHLGVVRIQQQNRLVEETNVTLLAKVCCFLIQSSLSKVFWAGDTTMFTYLVNGLPSSVIGSKTPIYMLRVFSWLASIKQGMLELVKVNCIFLGFNESGEYKKTFIGFSVDTGSVQVLQGVEFEVELQEDHAFEVEPQGDVVHIAGSQEVQTHDLLEYHLACDREQH
ncbi:zinc finger, CCHC-type containing protein [Tanacetum coccineum]